MDQIDDKDNQLCEKGHLMERKTTTTYKGADGGAMCTKCRKRINVSEGYYHCSTDRANYHNECLS